MQEKKAFEADVRSFAGIEETMDKSGLTICYAAKIRLNEALDKNRMRLAWKNTRAGEAFLQVSTREKTVTRVSEEFWQEPDFLEIPEESFKTAHLQANITQQEIEKYKVCSHLIVCQGLSNFRKIFAFASLRKRNWINSHSRFAEKIFDKFAFASLSQSKNIAKFGALV